MCWVSKNTGTYWEKILELESLTDLTEHKEGPKELEAERCLKSWWRCRSDLLGRDTGTVTGSCRIAALSWLDSEAGTGEKFTAAPHCR